MIKSSTQRKRTFKYKSPEWFEDVVVTVTLEEDLNGRITVTVQDPRKLITYIEHETEAIE